MSPVPRTMHYISRNNQLNITLSLQNFSSLFSQTSRELHQRTSGQSYKHFTLVNYDSRVVIWGIFQSRTTLES